MSTNKLPTNTSLSDRIKIIRKTNMLSQATFAESIGIKQPTLSEIEKGSYPPSASAMRLIVNQYRVREEWLETGEGEMFKVGEAQGEPEGKRALSRGKVPAEGQAKLLPLHPGDVVAMQVYVTGGAGEPYEFIPSEPIEEIIVPKTYYTRTIVPVKVRGRSMEKTLRDGAVVGVDRADRQVVNGELYAVWLPYQGTVIKRLYINTERIQIHSDNEEFRNEDISVALDKVDDNFIQGRVKWVIQLL